MGGSDDMKNRPKTCFRRAGMEDWLNAFSALVFIAALIYFIVTNQPELIPLGSGQQFCKCTPAMATTLITTGLAGITSCLTRVNPSTQQQSSGEYFDFFFFHAGFEYLGHNGEFNATGLAACAIEDIETVTYELGARRIVLPPPGSNFSCVKAVNTTTKSTHLWANLTFVPDEFAITSGIPNVKQFYSFKTEAFDFATISFNYVNVPADSEGRFQMNEAFNCLLFLDGRDWSSYCECPLNVIGNAVAIASITILIVLPLRFYRLCRPNPQAGDVLMA